MTFHSRYIDESSGIVLNAAATIFKGIFMNNDHLKIALFLSTYPVQLTRINSRGARVSSELLILKAWFPASAKIMETWKMKNHLSSNCLP